MEMASRKRLADRLKSRTDMAYRPSYTYREREREDSITRRFYLPPPTVQNVNPSGPLVNNKMVSIFTNTVVSILIFT